MVITVKIQNPLADLSEASLNVIKDAERQISAEKGENVTLIAYKGSAAE